MGAVAEPGVEAAEVVEPAVAVADERQASKANLKHRPLPQSPEPLERPARNSRQLHSSAEVVAAARSAAGADLAFLQANTT